METLQAFILFLLSFQSKVQRRREEPARQAGQNRTGAARRQEEGRQRHSAHLTSRRYCATIRKESNYLRRITFPVRAPSFSPKLLAWPRPSRTQWNTAMTFRRSRKYADESARAFGTTVPTGRHEPPPNQCVRKFLFCVNYEIGKPRFGG